jgi:hypothetical protein
MENIKILELDINYDKLVKNSVEAKKKVDEFTEALKKQKKEGASAEQIEATNAALRVAQGEYRTAAKMLTDLTAATNEGNLTIEQTRKALSFVSAQWAQLTEEEIKNTEEGQKLNDTKTALTANLKKLEAATGDTRRNVGNYTGSILEALKGTTLFGNGLGGAIQSLEQTKEAITLVRNGIGLSTVSAEAFGSGFAGAMQKVKIAVASTGIGLLIVAIGLVVSALMKMDSVTDKLEQVFAGFGGALTAVQNIIISFVSNVKSFGDAMTKIGEVMLHPIDSLKQFGKAIGDAADEAARIKKIQQDLEDSARGVELGTRQLENEAKQLEIQARNRSLSFEQQQDLLKRAQDKRDQALEINKKQINDQLKADVDYLRSKSQLSAKEIGILTAGINVSEDIAKRRGTISDDDLKKFKEHIAALQDIQSSSLDAMDKNQNRQDLIADKYAADQEKRNKAEEEALQKHNDLIIKGMEEALRLQEAMDERGKRKITDGETFNEEELRLANAFIAEKAIIDQKYQYEKDAAKGNADQLLVIETKHKADLAELNNKYNAITIANLKTLADASIASVDEQFKLFKAEHESRIKDDQILTEAIIEEEIKRLVAVKDAAEETARIRYQLAISDPNATDSDKAKAEEAYRAFQLDSEQNFLAAQSKLYSDHTQQMNEAKARLCQFHCYPHVTGRR